MSAGRQPPLDRDRAAALVQALCHEVGNLLAAAQIEAHLLRDPHSERRAAGTDRIAEMTARAASLVAQIRPLLDPGAHPDARADPLEVLDGLRRGLDEESDGRVRIELRSAAELPEIAADAEVLHQVLLTAVYTGLEASPDRRVRVASERDGDRIRFLVEDGGRWRGELSSDEPPRGRPLTQAIARALLAPGGGDIRVESSDEGTRVVAAVPVANV